MSLRASKAPPRIGHERPDGHFDERVRFGRAISFRCRRRGPLLICRWSLRINAASFRVGRPPRFTARGAVRPSSRRIYRNGRVPWKTRRSALCYPGARTVSRLQTRPAAERVFRQGRPAPGTSRKGWTTPLEGVWLNRAIETSASVARMHVYNLRAAPYSVTRIRRRSLWCTEINYAKVVVYIRQYLSYTLVRRTDHRNRIIISPWRRLSPRACV